MPQDLTSWLTGISDAHNKQLAQNVCHSGDGRHADLVLTGCQQLCEKTATKLHSPCQQQQNHSSTTISLYTRINANVNTNWMLFLKVAENF